jgi:phytoene synthase
MQPAYAHCAELVRTADKDRYLACLFLPAEVRPHAIALYAFNVEIASVRERTGEPLAGEIRLQWWRDALAGSAPGDVARNPVAAALLETIERKRLPRRLLEELIEARRFDLYNDVMATRAALESYLRATSSSLFHLIGRMLAGEAAIEKAADAAGLSYGLTGLLRALPQHAARRQVFLPAEVLAAFGVANADVTDGRTSRALLAALAEMRGNARRYLADARASITGLPHATRVAFLPLALVDGYLEKMDRPDYDPFRTPIEVPQWRRQWTLWRAAR